MSWTDAHRYYAMLRRVEHELDRTADGALPWRQEYAEVFGTPKQLLLALRTRWQTMVQAQVDDDADGQYRELAAAHPGLVRALTRAAQASRRGYVLAS